MLGVTPNFSTRYGTEIAILEHTGWSWRELQETPAALVDELAVRIEARTHWREKKRQMDEAIAKK